MLDKFIAWILSWVNIAIYVWGGQGQTITSEQQIRAMETSPTNANRAIQLWIKRGRKAVCFDCSGLLVKMLLTLGLISYDHTANDLMHKCTMIQKSQLKRGDWVFRIKNGAAYHIGVVVDTELNVVESMGRDDGVVKRGLDQHSVGGYWNAFGRPSYFKQFIEAQAADKTKYAEPEAPHQYRIKFTGNDAGWFETELHRIGYTWESMGCKDNKPDETVGSKVWDILDYEMDQYGKPRGAADVDIREYLKSLPSR